MSFIKLQPENFDTFSLTLRPRAEFVSSSSGLTGSVRLIERPSALNKTLLGIIDPTSRAYLETPIAVESVPGLLAHAAAYPSDRDEDLKDYLSAVNLLAPSRKNDVVIPIQRITQSIDFDYNSFTKSSVKNVLMPQYRSVYTDCDYSYKNYHTINFFTSSTVPSDSAIIYPNIDGQYTLSNAFSFDFYINPRYLADLGNDFNAGAILHMSSSICVSLHTGSHRNADGQVDQFRLAVGFKHSANVPPSSIDVSQTNSYNNSTGSFTVDATTSSFYYPSSSIAVSAKPELVILGNQYIGSDDTDKFFNSVVASSLNGEGVTQLNTGTTDPAGFTFSSPLNAEIHDVKLFNRVLTNNEVSNFRNSANDLDESGLIFYVPPIFTNCATRFQRDFVTPVGKALARYPTTPYNVNLAASTQIFCPNLQNFLFDIKNYSAPRLYKLTSSVEAYAGEKYAVDHMFRRPEFIKRAYTILPNDNGLFLPNFQLVPTSSIISQYNPYIDSLSNTDKTSISLLNIDTTGMTTSRGSGSVPPLSAGETQFYLSPEDYNTTALPTAGNSTTLFSFTTTSSFADRSSNLSTIYQVSNLYYGNQIFPESFTISSTGLTGSGGKIDITLKDNGYGGLYRADAITPSPTWASVGNLFYDEGLAIIKSPHLYYFGKDNFSVSFNGSQNIHTYTIDAICPAGEINSSSNPSYLSFPPTNEQNETADNFVYITGINIHDDNFNVIMRANLAQPVLKRPDEEFLFRIKYDM
jgi:hypothetical protein